jgi:hypothetical protein
MIRKVVTFDNLKGMPPHTITDNLYFANLYFAKIMMGSCGVVGVIESSLSQSH